MLLQSSVVLWVVTQVLLSGSLTNAQNQDKLVIACENSDLHIECAAGQVIKVIQANYGRLTLDTCPGPGVTESSLNCSSATSNQVVDDRCNGKERCTVPATNAVFGDPCHNVYKYLEVEFFCELQDGKFCEYIEDSQCSEETVRKACPKKCINHDCPSPWFWLGSQCFQVVDKGDMRQWSSSRAHCAVNGRNVEGSTLISSGDLAVPNNITLLYDYMLDHQIPEGNYWIGGSDWFGQEEWYWINGKKIHGIEPITWRTPECLYIINKNDVPAPYTGHEGCGATEYFVCERKFA